MISRSASGSSVESESTKHTISASVARMPAAIAARLPRLWEKRIACRFGKRRAANAIRSRCVGRAVVDGEHGEQLRRVVEREDGGERRLDRGLLVHGRDHDGDGRELIRAAATGR